MPKLISPSQREAFYELLVGSNIIEPFEDFALKEYLSDDEVVVIEKSRQVGMSFAMSVRCLIDALLGSSWIIFSESKEEARRKIGYMRNIVDGLRNTGYQINIRSLSRDFIEFEGGGSVVALSYKGSRGRGYSGNVLIDECFWVPSVVFSELLARINPARVRAGGVLRLVGSSSFRGHYLYDTNFESRSDRWERIRWWDSKYFCVDVDKARVEAISIPTAKRVDKFGTRALKQLYKDYESDIDFAREMECYVGDAPNAIISYETLMKCVDYDLDGGYYEGLIGFAEFLEEVKQRDKYYYAGVDIGRKNNHTEIILIDIDGNVLYNIDLGTVQFEEQKRVLSELLDAHIVKRISIDETGLGMDLVESLYSKYGDRVEGVTFSMQEKHNMARLFSRAIGMNKLVFYPLKDLLKQILDIKIEFTDKGNMIYKVSNARHNGDKFWALCLALRNLPGLEFSYDANSEYYSLPPYQAYGTRIDYVRQFRKIIGKFT